MPTYDYICDACKFEFEKFQSMSSEAVKVCPKCKKKKVRRLIGTGAGLIFKGSGFYITDYRDQGYKDKAKADSGTPSGGDAKADAKPDTKPAAETKSDAQAPKTEPSPVKTETPKSETKSKKKKD